jgi:Flp pilus assembly protein TadD
MTQLQQPDQFHLNASVGWLLLGNSTDSAIEFKKLSRSYPDHPDYLHVKCRVLIAERNWMQALETGRQQVRVAPHDSHGWVHQAYCLHELKRTDEAFQILAMASKRFPRDTLITYNLACYCCHLKRYNDALNWIDRTAKLVESSAKCSI